VENLEGLLAQLREEGVTVVDKIETYPYGKFGWIVDAEGNKMELWSRAMMPHRLNGVDALFSCGHKPNDLETILNQ
jgi:hypothetical protein